MIRPIKILPGEVIHYKIPDDHIDRKLLIVAVRIDCGELCVEASDNDTGSTYNFRYSRFLVNKKYCTRVGFVLKINMFDTEDYLCHDHRCYPSNLGGCSFCQYSGRSKQRKKLFYPGDEVYVPEYKKTAEIEIATLGFDFTELDREYAVLKRTYDSGILGRNNVLAYNGGRSLNSIIAAAKQYQLERLGIYYKMKDIGGFYRYDEIRMVKRKNYLIDLEQLDYICSEICLYGNGSSECKKCETKKYKDSIKDDLQRDYREI